MKYFLVIVFMLFSSCVTFDVSAVKDYCAIVDVTWEKSEPSTFEICSGTVTDYLLQIQKIRNEKIIKVELVQVCKKGSCQ